MAQPRPRYNRQHQYLESGAVKYTYFQIMLTQYFEIWSVEIDVFAASFQNI